MYLPTVSLFAALLAVALARSIQRPLRFDADADADVDVAPHIWAQHPFVSLLPSHHEADPRPADLSLIELAPGVSKYVTDDEKWALRRAGVNFMDITHTEDLGAVNAAQRPSRVPYPRKPAHNASIAPLLTQLNKTHMRAHLETFTAFHTRYYKSATGAESSAWLLARVNDTVTASGAHHHAGATVRHFPHPWGQHSVIATIPGRTNNTVVVAAHQDSINLFFPSLLAAPGADDDGSGTVTILEALRVALQDPAIAGGNATNTLEFHWYAAEEGGLLGSQAVFHSYARQNRPVKAMLQQDMTGYIQRTLDAGEPEAVGVITDFVDQPLTDFIKLVIDAYCTIPYTLTECGYACSDHASASKAGYPSGFVIESDFKYSDGKIHTSEDTIAYLDFDHMLQHARLTLGFVYELAFAAL